MSIFLFIPSMPIFQLFELEFEEGRGAMMFAHPQLRGSVQYVAPFPADQWREQDELGGPSGWRGPF